MWRRYRKLFQQQEFQKCSEHRQHLSKLKYTGMLAAKSFRELHSHAMWRRLYEVCLLQLVISVSLSLCCKMSRGFCTAAQLFKVRVIAECEGTEPKSLGTWSESLLLHERCNRIFFRKLSFRFALIEEPVCYTFCLLSKQNFVCTQVFLSVCTHENNRSP